MRGITDNYHHFFMVVAFFDSALLVRFLKKYSFGHFAFTILVFWGYGLGMFGAAAMKQITAMAVLTLSIDALKNRRWILYILIVLVAGLIHTYAIMFLVLPLFIAPPWNWRTLLLLALTVVAIFTFNTTISTVLDYVDELGRSVSEAEVFDGVSMNVFRVLVFAIVPVMLFVFRGRLVPQMDKTQYVFANMAIIAFMFALLGGVQGANMFGRLATYFMLGDICLLGWILNELFEEQSKRFITTIAVVLFIVFIIYDNKTIDNHKKARLLLGMDD